MRNSTEKILINILTRTSNRPFGFENLRYSIENQTYKNVRHIVSYDDDKDLSYIDKYDVDKIKVNSLNKEEFDHPGGFTPAHYNLYCNELLNQVEEGWIMFIDDDDCYRHNRVLQEIVNEIKKADSETLFIWKMRYPNGVTLPNAKAFLEQNIEIYNINTSCFLFHSKYKNASRWDGWKVSDYRFVKSLSEVIPKKKWLDNVYIQINNFGDLGSQNDIKKNRIFKLTFNKNFFWYLIPKYHYKIYDLFLFRSDFFELFSDKIFTSVRYRLKRLLKESKE